MNYRQQKSPNHQSPPVTPFTSHPASCLHTPLPHPRVAKDMARPRHLLIEAPKPPSFLSIVPTVASRSVATRSPAGRRSSTAGHSPTPSPSLGPAARPWWKPTCPIRHRPRFRCRCRICPRVSTSAGHRELVMSIGSSIRAILPTGSRSPAPPTTMAPETGWKRTTSARAIPAGDSPTCASSGSPIEPVRAGSRRLPHGARRPKQWNERTGAG